jgi:hypothetical protein
LEAKVTMQMGNPDEATNLFKKARDLIKSIPTAPKKSDAQLRGKDFDELVTFFCR